MGKKAAGSSTPAKKRKSLACATIEDAWRSALDSARSSPRKGTVSKVADGLLGIHDFEAAARSLQVPRLRSSHGGITKTLAACPVAILTARNLYPVKALVYLAWEPLLTFARAVRDASVAGAPLPPWESDLQRCADLLDAPLREAFGPDVSEPRSIDEVLQWTSLYLAGVLGADVSPESLVESVARVLPFSLPATHMSSLTLLASGACSERFGKTLAAKVAREVLSAALGAADLVTPDQLYKDIVQETLGVQAPQPHTQAEAMLGLAPNAAAPLPRRRDRASVWKAQAFAQSTMEFTVRSRLTLKTLPETLVEAEALISVLREESQGREPLPIASDRTLRRHLLWLDDALDCWLRDRIAAERGATFFGAALATDESPPSQPRFRGLRFQVTFLYIPMVPSVDTWDAWESPPLRVEPYLCDICNCPGKDGATVVGVVEKQLARVGLSSADMLSGTGDGGGENEGAGGVHQHMERTSPGDVRRRCMNHLAWTVCRAGLDEVDVKIHCGICTYLSAGVTWSSLKTIACHSVAEGGLGLFVEGSRAYQAVFSTMPATIVENRPESDMHFLRFLRGRERNLALCADQDVVDRGLAAGARHAAASLADVNGRIERSIIAELLHRALELARFGNKKRCIAAETSLDVLLAQSLRNISDVSCNAALAGRFDATPADLAAWAPRSWVEIAVRKDIPDEGEATLRMPRFQYVHRRVANRMQSHLQLTGENIYRTTWQAGALLSKDAVHARTSARALLDHLSSTAPRKRTRFETTLWEDGQIMRELTDFAAQGEPTQVWKEQGRWAALFRFLAPRFLANPDNVMDVERQHAVWQWHLAGRRALKLKSLNAWLKLSSYLRANAALPPSESLGPHVAHIRGGFAAGMRALIRGDTFAPGQREDAMYWDRLNLSVSDIALLKGRAVEPRGGPRHVLRDCVGELRAMDLRG